MNLFSGSPVQFPSADGQGGLALIDEGLRLVAQLLIGLFRPVLGSVFRGVLNCLLNLLLGQVGAGGDDDLLRVPRSQVPGGDLQDAVGVQIKGHLDLRHPPGGPLDAGQAEFTDGLVVPGHGALSLEDVDFHGGLEVGGGAEDLGVVDRQGGISVDEPGGHAAHRLDGQGEGRHVQQENLLLRPLSPRLICHREACACQGGPLNRRPQGDALIRVDPSGRLHSGEPANVLLNRRDPGAAAHQQDPAQLAGVNARVVQGGAYRYGGALHQIPCQALEGGAGYLHLHMHRAAAVLADEGQVDGGGGSGGQLDLGLFRRVPDPLYRHGVLVQVDVGLFPELADQIICQAQVEIVPAQLVVPAGGEDLNHSVADLDDGDVKGAAAQVVDHDLLGGAVVQSVGQGG